MTSASRQKTRSADHLPPHCRRVALVLQGGGALGAYQAGAYCTLAEAGYLPAWVAGVSIGAINAALIAGNPPELRAARLRAFWERLSSGTEFSPLLPGDQTRAIFNQWSALTAMAGGVSGFFEPRFPPAWMQPAGADGATSIYDSRPLRETLEDLVDFDLINAGRIRLSVGAVNVRSGNSIYFDNSQQALGPEHIMASGALPPGLPAIEIDGEHYWDGGVVSNTPLQYVLDDRPRNDSLVFQVDLFSARGQYPRDLEEVMERQKEVLYSSRTRFNTDTFKDVHNLRRAVCRLIETLPEELRGTAAVKLLEKLSSDATMSIVHLIYRRRSYESQSKDYEFSRTSMKEHWQAGVDDATRTLLHPEWLEKPSEHVGARTFDLTRDDGD